MPLTPERLRAWVDELDRLRRWQSHSFTNEQRDAMWDRTLEDMRSAWRDLLAKEVA